MNGFRMGDELKACFEAVDVDRSGGLEFSEVNWSFLFVLSTSQYLDGIFFLQFFALIYTWASRHAGGLQAFFTRPQNQNVVQKSMSTLIDAMKAYDSDRSMRLSRAETDALFRDQFSAHYSNYERAVTDLLPQVSLPKAKAPAHCAQLPRRAPLIISLPWATRAVTPSPS
jgi:hypothetical protein